MKKVININLDSEEDLKEKYNSNVVSRDLINYILDQAHFINRKDELEIIVNKNFGEDCVGSIKTGLRNEYLKASKETRFNNIKQITFLLLGLICLIIYAFLDNIEVVSEILLIGGWILMGEAIEIQLFTDPLIKRNKMILKKILKLDFIENNVEKK